MKRRRAVFLDRDGTLNVDVGYPSSYKQIRLFPSSVEAVRRINKLGLVAVIVTNQSGIARGFFSEDDLQRIHDRMAEDFRAEGARIDGFYHCPHLPPSAKGKGPDCTCRKPFPEMGLRAKADFGLDLKGSYMVGDKAEDIEFGMNIGARSILVLTGFGEKARETLRERGILPSFVAPGILEAAEWIAEIEKERADGQAS